MGMSHIQINKYERSVIQHHTNAQTIDRCPENQRQLERMKDIRKQSDE